MTYSDVHVQRLQFFRAHAGDREPASDGRTCGPQHRRRGSERQSLFYTTVGRGSDAADAAGLQPNALSGSDRSLVFLIDWNKARKRLGLLVPNGLAVELLDWAAEHSFGHRAFLQLGGERLVYDALDTAVRTPMRQGEPLNETMGHDEARDFLRFVLRRRRPACGRAVRAADQRPSRVDFFNHIRSAEQRLLLEGARHATLVLELAHGIEAALKHTVKDGAEHAKTIESRADEIVKATRATVRRIAGTEIYRRTATRSRTMPPTRSRKRRFWPG